MFFTSTLQNTTTMMKALKASLFLLALRCLTVASAAWHVDDESGLLAFKSAITHDPSGMLQDWKLGTDCCKWSNMDCLGENRVMTLSLTGQPGERDSFLFGTISPSLGKVQNLVGIYLLNLRNISGPFSDLFFSGCRNLNTFTSNTTGFPTRSLEISETWLDSVR